MVPPHVPQLQPRQCFCHPTHLRLVINKKYDTTTSWDLWVIGCLQPWLLADPEELLNDLAEIPSEVPAAIRGFVLKCSASLRLEIPWPQRAWPFWDLLVSIKVQRCLVIMLKVNDAFYFTWAAI
jgi:hypothetical protein